MITEAQKKLARQAWDAELHACRLDMLPPKAARTRMVYAVFMAGMREARGTEPLPALLVKREIA